MPQRRIHTPQYVGFGEEQTAKSDNLSERTRSNERSFENVACGDVLVET
jgi:hypothetical protein